jgi:hypothetical protein
MVGISALTIILVHIGEMLRCLLFFGGCAILPVFIAGLGVESLRAQCVRFIMSLVSVACWPIGWALAGTITSIIGEGIVSRMSSVSAVALGIAQPADVPALASSAPYLGWTTLFVFAAATVGVCLWVVGTFVYAPFAVARLVGSGVSLTGSWVGSTSLAPRAGLTAGAMQVVRVPLIASDRRAFVMPGPVTDGQSRTGSGRRSAEPPWTRLVSPAVVHLRTAQEITAPKSGAVRSLVDVGERTVNAGPSWLPPVRRQS